MNRIDWKTVMAAVGIAGTVAFVGNMLTIGLGFGGYWQSLDPTVFMAWFAENFFRFLIPTVMSVLPFSLIGLGASVWFARKDRSTQRYWAGALACVVVSCLITAVYHLPTNFAFASQMMSPAEASATLSTWLLMHWVRSVCLPGDWSEPGGLPARTPGLQRMIARSRRQAICTRQPRATRPKGQL